jgi:hypothetical protein
MKLLALSFETGQRRESWYPVIWVFNLLIVDDWNWFVSIAQKISTKIFNIHSWYHRLGS